MPIPVLIAIELEYRYRVHRASFAGHEEVPEDLRLYESKRRVKRMVQAAMLLFDFSYEVLTVTGFKGVQCLWTGSKYTLGVDSSIVRKCWLCNLCVSYGSCRSASLPHTFPFSSWLLLLCCW